jgi:thiazole/oxazole-forming peptide maturase SagD family component
VKSGIQVIGASDGARAIASALARESWLGQAPVTVVAEWDHVESLRTYHERPVGRYLLVEDIPDGHLAIGPLFDPAFAGCFDCYLARRRANGGRECRPPEAANADVLGGITEEVNGLRSNDRRLRGAQIEVGSGQLRRVHTFLPVPSCQTCSRRNREFRSLQPEDVISSRIGLVHEVYRISGTPNDLVAVEAIGCRTDAFSPVRALNRGMALARTEQDARRRAVAESIERYCAALPPESLKTANAAELDAAWVNPSAFPTVTIPFTRGARLRWVKGTMLGSEGEVWAPASLVYVPYEPAPDEISADAQFSPGLATGTDLKAAVQRALAEIVERDVSLRAWRMHSPIDAVDPREFKLRGLHLARIPNDSGLEVVAAFLEQPRVPFTSTGLGARPTLSEAAEHAVDEALQSRLWLQSWMLRNGPGFACPPRTMVDNALAHALRPELLGSRRRWLHPPVAVDIKNGHSSHWDEIRGRFPGACWIDITTPDVQQAGLRVVRVLAPGRILADDDALRPRIGGCGTPHPFG